MNVTSLTINHVFWSSLLMTLFLFLGIGCKVEDKTWIDKMLSEMESAWIEADKSSLGSEGRDAAVTAVAQKYFRLGMPEEESFRLLRELKDRGFEIRESRYEGVRAWPDKTILPWESAPYPDMATIKNMRLRYTKGASYFTVGKMYGRERVIIKKNVGISFKITDDTGVISAVKADIWTDSI